jgi:hypothetical membrane protein
MALALNNLKAAGALLFIGGAECILGIMLAETQYQGYSIANNAISDLGDTCVKSVCVVHQPSAAIFDSSVVLLGVLVIAASYFVSRSGYRTLSILTVLSGVGAICVGIFPESTGVVHLLASLVVFLFGGLASIASSRRSRPPMSYLSVVLGAVTLIALVLYASGTYLGLGLGGMERMVAYPALIWATAFGAYLMNGQDKN